MPTPPSKAMKTALKVTYTILGIVIFIVIAANLSESTPATPKAGAQPEKVSVAEDRHDSRIIPSTTLLAYRFNQFAAKFESDYRISDLTYETNPEDSQWVCKYFFNDNIGLLVTINKSDKSIKEVTMIGQGEGTLQSGIDIIMVMGGIMTAADPSLTPGDRGNILRKLHLVSDDKLEDNYSYHTTKNNIRYWVSKSEVTPMMFGASPATLD